MRQELADLQAEVNRLQIRCNNLDQEPEGKAYLTKKSYLEEQIRRIQEVLIDYENLKRTKGYIDRFWQELNRLKVDKSTSITAYRQWEKLNNKTGAVHKAEEKVAQAEQKFLNRYSPIMISGQNSAVIGISIFFVPPTIERIEATCRKTLEIFTRELEFSREEFRKLKEKAKQDLAEAKQRLSLLRQSQEVTTPNPAPLPPTPPSNGVLKIIGRKSRLKLRNPHLSTPVPPPNSQEDHPWTLTFSDYKERQWPLPTQEDLQEEVLARHLAANQQNVCKKTLLKKLRDFTKLSPDQRNRTKRTTHSALGDRTIIPVGHFRLLLDVNEEERNITFFFANRSTVYNIRGN